VAADKLITSELPNIMPILYLSKHHLTQLELEQTRLDAMNLLPHIVKNL
jgi:hypothetical protein